MTHEKATRTLRKIYRVLAKPEDLKISIDRKIPEHGIVHFYSTKPAQLKLNPSRRSTGGIVSTVIHELLHIVYFGMSERKIRVLEKQVYQNLTDRQLTNLLKRVASCLK